MSVWQKYCEKKYKEPFLASPEYKVLSEVLDEFHPERWELGFKFEEFNWKHELHSNGKTMKFKALTKNLVHYFNIKIYFPIINIKNRNNDHHVIRDLYCKIEFPLNREDAIIGLRGIRSTISMAEYSSAYGHSHLSTSWRPAFQNKDSKEEDMWMSFCKGDSELGLLRKKEFLSTDANSVRHFLMVLQSYLEYESLEGGPHCRMENVTTKERLHKINVDNYDFSRIIKKGMPPVKINKQLKITNFTEVEEWLAPFCDAKAIKENGVYFTPTDESVSEQIEKLNGRHLFNFRGEPITLKIDNYVKETRSKRIAHPKYTRAICDYWEGKVFEKYLASCRTQG